MVRRPNFRSAKRMADRTRRRAFGIAATIG